MASCPPRWRIRSAMPSSFLAASPTGGVSTRVPPSHRSGLPPPAMYIQFRITQPPTWERVGLAGLGHLRRGLSPRLLPIAPRSYPLHPDPPVIGGIYRGRRDGPDRDESRIILRESPLGTSWSGRGPRGSSRLRGRFEPMLRSAATRASLLPSSLQGPERRARGIGHVLVSGGHARGVERETVLLGLSPDLEQ
jgi:hypothetical protein